jgi:hypothetical protein
MDLSNSSLASTAIDILSLLSTGKNEQTAAILKRQADQITELESLYREEQVLRKRYFNMMEGKLSLHFCCKVLLSISYCSWLLLT